MAAPEGYTKLGKVGFNYRGEYDPEANYDYHDVVYYQGSTYVALCSAPPFEPREDGINWRFLARGYETIKNIVPLFIGDSYANGDVGGIQNSWCTLVMNNFKEAYAIRSGGLGFSGKGTDENLMWLTKLKEFVANNNISSITDVVIVGGYNDHYTDAAANQQYIRAFFEYAHTVFDDKVRFHLGMCGWCGLKEEIVQPTATQASNLIRQEIIQNVATAYANLAAECKYAYMGNLSSVLHNYIHMFADDGYHPSMLGQKRLANAIYSYLIGGNFSIVSEFGSVIFKTANNTNVPIAQGLTAKTGVQLCAYPLNNLTAFTTNVVIPYGTSVEIGTITETQILGVPNLRLMCKIRDRTNAVTHDGVITFTSNKVLLNTWDSDIPANSQIAIWVESKCIAYEYC